MQFFLSVYSIYIYIYWTFRSVAFRSTLKTLRNQIFTSFSALSLAPLQCGPPHRWQAIIAGCERFIKTPTYETS